MPALALLCALGSAVSSAVWNMLLKGAQDNEATSAVALAVGAVLFLPSLAFGRISAGAWPWIAASAALELVYFFLLATAYRRAEMSLVFPLARGLAPVLVLLFGLVVLGNRVSAGEAVGVVVLGGGAIAVRGLRVGGGWGDAGLAAAISGCVAGYTLVDKHGVTLAAPAAYFEVIVVVLCIPNLAVMAIAKGPRALSRQLGWRSAVIGAGVIGGYDLILEALRLASAAPVAAVRESSVVIGTGLAAVFLHERVTPARWAGVVMVATGVVLLALFAP